MSGVAQTNAKNANNVLQLEQFSSFCLLSHLAKLDKARQDKLLWMAVGE